MRDRTESERPATTTGRALRRLRYALTGWYLVVATIAVTFLTSSPAFGDVTLSPTAPPGSDGIQDLLNWTSYTAAAACAGTAMYGLAKMGISQRNDSFSGANHGKSVFLLGGLGALGLGLTPTIINALTAVH
jgi:hypothetical protein